MSSNAASLVTRLHRKTGRQVALVTEATALHANGALSSASLNAAHESALLGMVADFEVFLEELFYAVLLGKAGLTGCRARVDVGDRGRAQDMLLADAGAYVKWLPFAGTLERADAYLVGGRPFARLRRRAQEKGQLEEIRKVRNAIAHDSGAARVSFVKLAAALPSRQRTPAAWLAGLSQGQPRLHGYASALNVIGAGLADRTEAVAISRLSPEDPWRAGDHPGRGTYRCQHCGSAQQIPNAGAQLPTCPACGGAQTACPTCGRGGKSLWRRAR